MLEEQPNACLDELKMALRAQKVSRAFEKRAPGQLALVVRSWSGARAARHARKGWHVKHAAKSNAK